MFAHILPEIHVHDSPPQRRKTKAHRERRPMPSKYNHFEMLQDRIRGMSWDDIAKKHNVNAKGKVKPGATARYLALMSSAAKKLKPAEVAALHVHGDSL